MQKERGKKVIGGTTKVEKGRFFGCETTKVAAFYLVQGLKGSGYYN